MASSPIEAPLIRIIDNEVVDLNSLFEASDSRGISLIWYANNSSYKPDSSGGMMLQYCWNKHTGMQLAFSGVGKLYIRWNLGAIGNWIQIQYV